MSTERRLKPRHRNSGAALAVVAGASLAIGGGLSSAVGYVNFESESKTNNQQIGAIERGLELEMNRPNPESLKKAKDLFETIATEEDKVTSFEDTREVFDVSSSLVSRAAVINEGNEILKTEVAFQDKKDALVEAVGANDIDDANVWTLVAGAATAVAGVAITASAISSVAARERKKPSDS